MSSDSKFFTTTKRGEIQEWKDELNSVDRDRQKQAVKKVIAAMTVGRDVSMLFPDVCKLIQTPNLELKKLVYLYLMNYAKSQPDLAIMAVNTFVKDSSDPNPLVRALAVRTMGCIRVEKITEYLCEPLRRCLNDEDPYVRKTAAVCVAKLFDINPTMVVDQGFLEKLTDLLGDANPMVVANAVAAMSEIAEKYNTTLAQSESDVLFRLEPNLVRKLLGALNECTEWGQVFISDALAQYIPQDYAEAEMICERVSPRLQHANCAVVLSAVKVILLNLDFIEGTGNPQADELSKGLLRKMAPPLVTLLSAEPEIQYVALRNINLVIQKRPDILSHEIKVFFCKYNDPIYVKMEKLDIMMKLVNEKKVEQVLMEFKEYATEVDVDFVRKSVYAIGQCAIKLPRAAQRCVDVLLELIQTKVNYVVQEAIIVIKDIFRKYPNQYESIISNLCENLDRLDEPDAKASMIWIIGEYAERIANSDELIDQFLENFTDEPTMVQLQLLTATIKLFLKRPQNAQQLVQKVLTLATEHSDNPDLRDRGYVYWRLLHTSPEAAKAVVLTERPTISSETTDFERAYLDSLIAQLSTLASVYHKPPEMFIQDGLSGARRPGYGRRGAGSAAAAAAAARMADDDDDEPLPTSVGGDAIMSGGAPTNLLDLDDILGGSSGGGSSAPAARAPTNAPSAIPDMDSFLMEPVAAPVQAAPAQIPLPILCSSEQGFGTEVRGRFSRRNGVISLDLRLSNFSQQPVLAYQVQFNKNLFGVAPVNPRIEVPSPLGPGVTADASVACTTSSTMSQLQPQSGQKREISVQIAIRNSDGKVFYLECPMPLHVVFVEKELGGQLTKEDFLAQWKSLPDDNERSQDISLALRYLTDIDGLQSKLEAHRMFSVARRMNNNVPVVYFSALTVNRIAFLGEITVNQNNQVRVSIRSATPAVNLSTFVPECVRQVLLD